MPHQGKVFLHALTLGLNVAFARLATDVAQRQRWGRLTYAAAAIAALTQFEPVPITIYVSSRGFNPARPENRQRTSVRFTCTPHTISFIPTACPSAAPPCRSGNLSGRI
jgi:hypothetical protein